MLQPYPKPAKPKHVDPWFNRANVTNNQTLQQTGSQLSTARQPQSYNTHETTTPSTSIHQPPLPTTPLTRCPSTHPNMTTKPRTKKPPSPRNHRIFGPWNSSSTGHQHSENPHSVTATWKETRLHKLERQFRSGDCHSPKRDKKEQRSASTLAFDGTCGSRSPSSNTNGAEPRGAGGEWRWVSDAEAKQAALGVRDIRSFMGVSKRKAGGKDDHADNRPDEKKAKLKVSVNCKLGPSDEAEMASAKSLTSNAPASSSGAGRVSSAQDSRSNAKLFAGTTVYVNGSTLPQISDQKLKHLLVAHGAQISISMARKTVSHIVVGQPNARSASTGPLGAGGGLAASKLQREISRGGCKSAQIVGVDWVLESIKAGRRLAESRFGVVHVADKGQKSVASMFGSR